MRWLRPTTLALLMTLTASAGLGGALWCATASVRTAELRLLEAETAAAARLAREPGGVRLVHDLLGDRVALLPAGTGDALDVEVSGTGVPSAGSAPVLDADGWDVVGRVVVTEDVARVANLPATVHALALLACVLVSAVARMAVNGARSAPARLRWPASAWLVATACILSVPLVAGERWAASALTSRSEQRLDLATRLLRDRADLDRVVAAPSGVLNLTGLRFVSTGADTDRGFLASGLPAPVAQVIATAPGGGVQRLTVEHVPYVTADVGRVRLILLPFDHVLGPGAAMVALAAVGLVAGLPLLVLASSIGAPRRARRELVAWSFVAPGLLHLVAFTVGPLLFAAWLSLHRWSLVDPARPFVWFENYAALAANPAFWNAMLNTALFTLHVPVSMAIALALALLVRRPGRASVVARAAFFLPGITSLVAVAMVWQWLLNDEYGLANTILSWVGLPRVAWLSSPSVALLSIMIVATWTTVGFQVVLFQAGLTAIPQELYDAARIDGARAWQRFRHVTWPGLRPTLVFVLITSIIGSFQVFGTVYVMTEGGPLHATDVAVFHIYEEAWELQRVGSAAAMSWTLFAVIFAITWLHFRALERRAGS